METTKTWEFASEEEIQTYNKIRSNKFLLELQIKAVKQFVYFNNKQFDSTKIDSKLVDDYIAEINNELCLLIIDNENLERFK